MIIEGVLSGFTLESFEYNWLLLLITGTRLKPYVSTNLQLYGGGGSVVSNALNVR